jgi:eukaryotic-like serine/threonine-protein kinase
MPRPADQSNDTAPATGLASTPGDYRFTPGERVGRHVVLERIGGGGMGVVYSAYDPKLDRRVALKLLRPDATGSAEAQEHLLREAQTLARLAHPNVVNVHDAGELDGRVYVEMELVQGRTLAEWLAAEPRTWQAVLEVFLQAGRGLAAAHAVGIVHRDFKPDNVLVGDDRRVRVADFGIALSGAEAHAAAGSTRGTSGSSEQSLEPLDGSTAPPVVRSLAKSGGGVGTPAYMAPEQRGTGATDARADQYSFCLTLYEALHGTRPGSNAASSAPTSRKCPAWLDRAIARGLSTLPEGRYPSMEALLDVLASEPRRRRRRWRIAASVVGAALVAGSTWAGVRNHHQGQALLCSGADREIGGAWGDAQKTAIADAFARTGLPYATRASAQVTAALDRYAHDWAAMYTDACEATRVRGEQSDAVMDKRMQCLDRRLTEAKTLAEVFEKGDPGVVERAALASQRLSPVADCSAARARGTSVGAAKADPAIVRALGRASALNAAGRYADAIQSAQEALDAARTSGQAGQPGQASLEAQALEMIGKTASQQGDGPRAERVLFDAFVAAEKSGDEVMAARAATESGFSIGYLQNRGEEAEKWFRLASVAIDRLGGDDRLEVQRLYAKSGVSWSAGRFKDSIDETRRALRLSEEKLPGASLERAYCLTGLGVSLMSQGNTEEARGFLEQALAIDEKELGPDHPNVEMDLFNLATLAHSEGRYDDARTIYERTITIGDEVKDAPMLMLSHAGIAESLLRLGRYADADEHVARAMTIAETSRGIEIEKSRIADLHSIRGRLARLEKRYDDARRELEEAIAIDAKALGKDNPDVSGAIVELARVDLAQGDAKRAIPLLERALVLIKDVGPSELAEPRLALAQALWQTGGDRKRATELAAQARELYARVPAKRVEVKEIEDWFAKNGGPP